MTSWYETRAKFDEPDGNVRAGTKRRTYRVTPYEHYMYRQGIPIHGGPGWRTVKDLELGDWERIGGRGAFLVPDGTLDCLGVALIEIPPKGALKPQRHMHEALYYVMEGRGTTEIWQENGVEPQRFEWRAGTLFAVPLNCSYRHINAGNSRVLLVQASNAPIVFNVYDDEDFIYRNNYTFSKRYDASPDYFVPMTDTLASPDEARAMWLTNIMPDIVNLELPLDNQRSPGYRRIEPHMGRGKMFCFIGEYRSGRYSKAHSHASGAILICLTGKGYTYNWPHHLGHHPWQDGKSDQVECVEYEAGGLVAAAPGIGDWLHQHFEIGKEPMRFLAFVGGMPGREHNSGQSRRWFANRTDGGVNPSWDFEEGGRSISYRTEDPFVRAEYERRLAEEGVEFTMPKEVYE